MQQLRGREHGPHVVDYGAKLWQISQSTTHCFDIGVWVATSCDHRGDDFCFDPMVCRVMSTKTTTPFAHQRLGLINGQTQITRTKCNFCIFTQ